MTNQSASAFAALHQGPQPLVLANAWDAASARIVETLGGKAIATSSAAVAWAHGYADGHDLPTSRLVMTVEDIVRAVRMPVSVDAEGGYGADAAAVGKNVASLIDAGAVGINLEDGHDRNELHCAKIAAAREAGERAGVALFINARVDVYLKKQVPPEQAVEETIRRGRAIKAAGASGFFVPGAVRAEEIAAIAEAIDLPLNVLAFPGLPPLAELSKLGVRRLSAGAALGRVAFAAARAAAETFLAQGDSAALLAAAGPSVDYNVLFKG
ncbi:MAG: isocitrate lyase/phosphoenolpyruvate mutase family protein [Pseudomonadota bacterium]